MSALDVFGYKPTLTGWLLTFVVGAAREVDERTGSLHQEAIMHDIQQRVPMLWIEYQTNALFASVGGFFDALLQRPPLATGGAEGTAEGVG